MTSTAPPTIYNRPDCMVPIGDALPGTPAAGDIVEFVLARRQGIINALSRPLRLAASCRRIVPYGEDTDVPSEIKCVVNKIKLAVETQVANHLKEPAQVTIEPSETGEYAQWYWCGPPEAAQQLTQPVLSQDPMGNVGQAADEFGQPMSQPLIDPMYLGAVMPDGTVVAPLPLPNELVKVLKQMAEVDPDTVDPTFICKLNDEYTAKTLQKVFDSDWRLSKGDKWLRSRTWANCVEGWQLPFYEYDVRRQQHLLRRNSIDGTYIDQSVEDIDDAAEAGIDLYLDLDEAVSLYPDQRDAILNNNAWISEGSMTPPSGMGKTPIQFRENFRRPMVRKIVWWIRNQPVGVQAALKAGLVQQAEMPNEPFGSMPAPMAGDTGDALQQGTPGGDGLSQGSPPTSPLAVGDAGDAQLGALPSVVAPVASYLLPDTGQPVTPDSPDWPTALRQITVVADTLVEDIICPMPDIPLGHMRNTLVVGRPWGLGEPFHTKLLQDAYSKITDDAVEFVHAAAFPAREMHAGLYDYLEAEYGNAHVKSRTTVKVPADYWNAQTPFVRTIEQPTFPASSMNIREMIGEDFNQVAGRPDVLAGNTPTAQASGKMVVNLQAAAVEPLNFKAQEITYCLEKIATLILYSILHYKRRADIAKATSVPEPLLELVLQRGRDRVPNVKPTISTGAGATIDRKRQLYLQLNQTIDPMDKTPIVDGDTTREAMGLDAAEVRRRNQGALRNAAQTMAPFQQQEEQQQGSGKSNSNGNGKASSNGNGRFGHE